MRYFIFIICIFSLVSKLLSSPLEGNVAKVNLTPPLEWEFALGGYGERMSQPAQGIHDRIWAKALVLKQGEKKYALVTLDLLALPPNVKPQVVEKLAGAGWSVENVMLLSSHSHTSLNMTALNNKNSLNIPQLGIFHQKLLDFVVKSIAEAIQKASRDLRPVLVGTGRVSVENLNENRRGDDFVDQDLTVTRVDLAGGNPLAVLVNWTAHPTLVDEKDMWLSGAWPGFLQRELEGWIGGDIAAMYFNGAEGDQRPVRPPGGSHYEQAEIYGRQIARQAWQLYRTIQPKQAVKFDFNYHEVQLPKPVAHPLFKATGGAEYGMTDQVMKIILNRMCPVKTSICALRVGELLVVSAPGELVAELGLRVKKKLSQHRCQFPVIGGLGNEWISYILTKKQYEKGGYEASVSFYGPDLGKTIVQGMLQAALPLTQ